MRIPRFYLPAVYQPGLVVELNKDQTHYALTVLRLKNGHLIDVFDGQGQQARASLRVINKRTAQVTLVEISQPQTESPLHTRLLQGISRGERMDYALQKAVELGVSEIQPLFTERCEVRLEDDKQHKRREQWQALVVSACEQSGRCVVPQVNPIKTLTEWFTQNPQAPGLVLDPYSQKTLSQLPKPDLSQSLPLLIGPEGGLSENEVLLAQQQGFQGIRLGPRILRTETAAPVILSLLQAQWGDLI